ncbi:MAG TPA: histidinol-phosphate transaminase [Steroidobacteraceae bacterium]|jgi:histidinol-phosphate aminotransferase|nr:histidinol-phosphate transaminase [Steroidobacteraceae bacterium]
MNPILELARPDILSLQPYQHAAWEPSLERMHANEMPWRASGDTSIAGLNRYPQPQPAELIAHLARLYGVAPDNVLAGRGSDEGIDLLVRVFCRAGQDSVLICPPTFGMYKVSARIQGAGVVEVPLQKDRGFALDTDSVLDMWRSGVKLLFLCTPNNPTGNLLGRAAIESLCEQLRDRAIVVVDEAYIEFAGVASLVDRLERYPNLVILRTLSKAYALAGARCGALLAHAEVVSLLARVITPYALPTQTIEAVLKFTDGPHRAESQRRIETIRAERARLSEHLARLPAIRRVWPSDSNFILVDCVDADRVLRAAAQVGLIIRDPRSQPGLGSSLRISVGTTEQNDRLLQGIARTTGATLTFAHSADTKPPGTLRIANVARRTKETDVNVEVRLDEETPIRVATGIGFFDHMLEQVAKHGGFSLQLSCSGDLHIDEHHTVEDCALALGQALKAALGDKRGIQRYGFLLPMDEALAQVAIDLSGRPYFVFDGQFGRDHVGELPTELVPHFFRSLAETLGAAINIKVTGENTHHMIEACFKGVGRALRQAIRVTDTQLPSTKGTL